MRKSFTPAVDINTVARIKAMPEETCFIMEQRQPADMWDPEDNLDLVPYGIWSRGTEEEISRYWNSLSGKIDRAAAREAVDIFCETSGRDFTSITVIKGMEVITYTVCRKEKALQLAF